jgi:hypothetical protein
MIMKTLLVVELLKQVKFIIVIVTFCVQLGKGHLYHTHSHTYVDYDVKLKTPPSLTATFLSFYVICFLSSKPVSLSSLLTHSRYALFHVKEESETRAIHSNQDTPRGDEFGR